MTLRVVTPEEFYSFDEQPAPVSPPQQRLQGLSASSGASQPQSTEAPTGPREVSGDEFYSLLEKETGFKYVGEEEVSEGEEDTQDEGRTIGSTTKDVGISIAKGIVGLGEAAVGLADIPTMGYAGKGLSKIGYDPKTTQDLLSDEYSPEQKEAFQKVQKAEGFIDTTKTAIQNPSTIAHSVIESAPSMLGGGGIARGILKVAPKFAPFIAGAIGEGAVTAGSGAEQTRQRTEDGLLTPSQAAINLGAGFGTSAISLVGGRIAQKLGIADVDTLLAGQGANVTRKGIAKRIIGGGISEGVFEELPQSAQEQVWLNAATDKPLLDGVDQAAAQGLLAGTAMGGGVNIIAGSSRQADTTPLPPNDLLEDEEAPEPPPEPQPQPAPTEAMPEEIAQPLEAGAQKMQGIMGATQRPPLTPGFQGPVQVDPRSGGWVYQETPATETQAEVQPSGVDYGLSQKFTRLPDQQPIIIEPGQDKSEEGVIVPPETGFKESEGEESFLDKATKRIGGKVRKEEAPTEKPPIGKRSAMDQLKLDLFGMKGRFKPQEEATAEELRQQSEFVKTLNWQTIDPETRRASYLTDNGMKALFFEAKRRGLNVTEELDEIPTKSKRQIEEEAFKKGIIPITDLKGKILGAHVPDQNISQSRTKPGQAAGELTEDTKINGKTFAQLEDMIMNDKPGMKKELEAIKAEHGREGLQDLVNPGKLYARLRRRLVQEQGMSKERAIDVLQGPFERYEQRFKEVEGQEESPEKGGVENVPEMRGQEGQGWTEGEVKTEITDTFDNAEDGTQGIVAKIDKGYSATLKDVDSGEYLGTAYIYKTREEAVKKAKEMAGIKDQPTVKKNLPVSPESGEAKEKQTEGGVVFETDTPVTFTYLKNKEKAPDMGERFKQHIEPKGNYVTHHYTKDRYLIDKFPDKYETGEMTFKNPLVVEIKEALDHKDILHERYGKTGVALSRAIVNDGYDGIVSRYSDGSTGEIIDLRAFVSKTPTDKEALRQQNLAKREAVQAAREKKKAEAVKAPTPQALQEKANKEKAERMAKNAANAPNFRAWIRAKGGLTTPTLRDHGLLDDKAYIGIRNKNGMGIDEMLHMAITDGWIMPGATEEDFVDAIEKNTEKVTGTEEDLLKAHEDDYNKYIEQLEAEARNDGATDEQIEEVRASSEADGIQQADEDFKAASDAEEAELVSIFGKDWNKPQSDKLVLTSEEGTAWDKGEVKDLGPQGKKAVFPTEKKKTADYRKQANLFGPQKGENLDLFDSGSKPETKLNLSSITLDNQTFRDNRQAVGQFRKWMRTAGIPKALLDALDVEVKDAIKIIGNVRRSEAEHGKKLSDLRKAIGSTTFFDDASVLVQFADDIDLIKAEDTAYHEAFHVMLNKLVSEENRTALLDHYKGNEEDAAKAFSKFVVNQETTSVPKPIRKIFYQIKRILTRIGNAFRQSQYEAPEDFFRAIYFGADLRGGSQATGINEFAQSVKLSLDKAVKKITDNPNFVKWFGDSKVKNENGEPLVVYHGSGAAIIQFDKNFSGKRTEADSAKKAFFFTDSKTVAQGYAENAPGKEFLNSLGDLSINFDVKEKLMKEQGEELNKYHNDFILKNKTTEDEIYNDKNLYIEYSKGYDSLNKHYRDKISTINKLFAEIHPDRVKSGSNIIIEAYLKIENPFVYDFKGAEHRDEAYSDLISEALENGHDGVIFKNTYDSFGESNSEENSMIDVYAVFHPTQIKSIYNAGTFDPNNPDIRLQVEEKGKQETEPSVKPTPRIDYIGDMEDADGKPFGLYNVFGVEGVKDGSTVTENTLKRLGLLSKEEKTKNDVLFQDENENDIVYSTNQYRISVNKPTNANHIVLWSKQNVKGRDYWRKSGHLTVTEKNKKINGISGKYLVVSEVEIDKEHRGQRLGKKLYETLIKYAGSDISGILSYEPTRVNKKQVPAIYKSLGAFNEGDYQVIPINKSVRETKLNIAESAKEFHDDMNTFMGDAIDFVKGVPETVKTRAATKAGMKVDSTAFDRYIKTPFHYFRKVPAAWRMFQDALGRSDNYWLKVDELSKAPDGQYWTLKINNAKKQNPEEYKKIQGFFKHRDQNAIGSKVVKKKKEDKYVLYGLPKGAKRRRVKQGEFTTEAAAWEQAIQNDLAFLRKKGVSEQGLAAAEATMRIRHTGFDMLARNMREVIAKYEELGMDLPKYSVWINGESVQVDLKLELARMGDMRGYYMPRSWKPGGVVLYAKKAGAHPRLETFDTVLFASNRKRDMVANEGFRTEDIEIKKAGRMPEDVFDMAGKTIAVNAMLNEALTRLKKKDFKLSDFDLEGKVADGPGKNKDFMLIGATNKRQNQILKDKGGKWYRGSETEIERWHFANKPPGFEKRLAKSLAMAEVATTVDQETTMLFAGGLAEQIGNVIKERGSRKHMIRRNDARGMDVREGYEEDLDVAMAQYVRSLAAGEAKHVMAVNMVKHLTGTDIPWSEFKAIIEEETGEVPEYEEYLDFVSARRIDPAQQANIFKDTTTYMKDVLRNQETADRVIGVIRGLAVLKYLGLKLSALPVNMSAMATTVPAAMKAYADIDINKAFGHLTRMSKAYTQYERYKKTKAPGLLSQKHIDLFAEMESKGWGKPQFNREAISTLENKASKGYSWLIEKAMVPFAITETFNRMVTISAAYEGLKKAGKDHAEALEAAKDVSDYAHAVYGKANYPHLMRGENIAAQALKMGYVFKQFTHNYLQTMWDMGWNKRDAKATLWMAASPMFLGGAGAFAGTAIFNSILKALGADDPEEWFYSQVEENLGEKAGIVARVGAPGLFGVSLKGSLALHLTEPPTTIPEVLGAPASVIGDIWEGGRNIARGEISKGIERLAPAALAGPIKAVREATEGVTTRSNLPVYYGKKPLVADTGDAIVRFMGFSPAKIAIAKEKQWNEKQVEQKYTKRRSAIYAKFHQLYLQPASERTKAKYIDLLSEVKEYNDNLIESGLVKKGYSPITQKLLRMNIKRGFQPSKKERLRE